MGHACNGPRVSSGRTLGTGFFRALRHLIQDRCRTIRFDSTSSQHNPFRRVCSAPVNPGEDTVDRRAWAREDTRFIRALLWANATSQTPRSGTERRASIQPSSSNAFHVCYSPGAQANASGEKTDVIRKPVLAARPCLACIAVFLHACRKTRWMCRLDSGDSSRHTMWCLHRMFVALTEILRTASVVARRPSALTRALPPSPRRHTSI